MTERKDSAHTPPECLDNAAPKLISRMLDPPPECWDPRVQQAGLAKELHDMNNAATEVIARMLDPRGYGGWKLVLMRCGPGARGTGAFTTAGHYYKEVKGGGKRGAVKRTAVALNMEPEAVRSALRRMNNTHGPRRKRKSGRK